MNDSITFILVWKLLQNYLNKSVEDTAWNRTWQRAINFVTSLWCYDVIGALIRSFQWPSKFLLTFLCANLMYQVQKWASKGTCESNAICWKFCQMSTHILGRMPWLQIFMPSFKFIRKQNCLGNVDRWRPQLCGLVTSAILT